MKNNTYIKKDLIDYAIGDVSSVLENSNSGSRWNKYPTRRVDAVEKVLPDRATVESVRAGSYSGIEIICVDLDGYIWLRHGYYGSCTGCDAYLHDAVSETERILRGAYCFESKEDAIEYLEETDDYAWNGKDLKSDAIVLVECL